MVASSAADSVVWGLTCNLRLHVVITLIAAAALTDAFPQSMSVAGPHRALTQSPVTIPDAAAGCPSNVPPPPQDYLNHLRDYCRAGESNEETCARCSCVLVADMSAAGYDTGADTQGSVRTYFHQVGSLDLAEATACTTLAARKAGVPEGVIKVASSKACSWEVARRQPACGTTIARVTGCPIIDPNDIGAMKANCSAADAASARATCVRCQCRLMDSAFQAGLRGSTGSGKCLTAQAMPAVSEAMLKAIASPECQVPDSELAAKCPNLDPRLALALAKTGTGAQTGAGAKSGAGSAARVSLGAAWMLVVLLVLL